MSDAIPTHILAAAGRAARFNLLALLNVEFARSGLTYEQVATRMGWSRARVRRVLRGRVRLTLRTAAELAWCISGARLVFGLDPSNPPLLENEMRLPND